MVQHIRTCRRGLVARALGLIAKRGIWLLDSPCAERALVITASLVTIQLTKNAAGASRGDPAGA